MKTLKHSLLASKFLNLLRATNHLPNQLRNLNWLLKNMKTPLRNPNLKFLRQLWLRPSLQLPQKLMLRILYRWYRKQNPIPRAQPLNRNLNCRPLQQNLRLAFPHPLFRLNPTRPNHRNHTTKYPHHQTVNPFY